MAVRFVRVIRRGIPLAVAALAFCIAPASKLTANPVCPVSPAPGQHCDVSTSCFAGVCHCVVVCGPADA